MSSRTHVWMGNCFFEVFLVFRKWNEINLICLHYCCLPIHFNNWSFILLVYDKNCVICALTHLRTEFFCSIYGKLKPSDFMTATIRHLLTVCIGSPSANFESTACDNKCSAKSWCIVKNSKKMHRPSERNLWAAHMAPKVNVGDQVTVTAAKKKRKRRQQPAEGYIFFGPFWPRRTNCQRSAPGMGGKMFKITKAAYGECRHICCSFAFGFCGTLAMRSWAANFWRAVRTENSELKKDNSQLG